MCARMHALLSGCTLEHTKMQPGTSNLSPLFRALTNSLARPVPHPPTLPPLLPEFKAAVRVLFRRQYNCQALNGTRRAVACLVYFCLQIA